MRRWLAVGAALLIIAAVAACGSDQAATPTIPDGELSEPIAAFYSAMKREDWEAVCARLSTRLRERSFQLDEGVKSLATTCEASGPALAEAALPSEPVAYHQITRQADGTIFAPGITKTESSNIIRLVPESGGYRIDAFHLDPKDVPPAARPPAER